MSDENKEKYQFEDNWVDPILNSYKSCMVKSKENYKFDLGVIGLSAAYPWRPIFTRVSSAGQNNIYIKLFL